MHAVTKFMCQIILALVSYLTFPRQLPVVLLASTSQGKFEAMKTLSDHRVPHCGKHQFRAKITVSSYLNHFLSYRCLDKVVVMKKNGTFTTAHVYV